jgi:hypothetical protein
MRYLIPALISTLLIVSACTNHTAETVRPQTEQDSLTDEDEIVAPVQLAQRFPSLYDYYKTQDSSFGTREFEEGELLAKDQDERSLDTTELKTWYPYLVYNSDRTRAVDFVSGHYVLPTVNGNTTLQQGGPDTEVGLIDFAVRKTKRLLFLGSSSTLLEALWLDPQTILLAGAEDTGNGTIRPVFWKYSMTDKKMIYYTYPDSIRAEIGDYAVRQLNARAKTTPSF